MITLKTLPTATAQEVFDHIVNHLLTQGEKSTSPDDAEVCVYHSPNGLKCAAGCLIAEDEYNPLFEKRHWRYLIDNLGLPEEHAALIRMTQKIHDNKDPEHWPRLLELLAAEFELEWRFKP